jgi:hypothetical protein
MDNWNEFDSSKKEEIAKKLFFHNVINDKIPKDTNHMWEDTKQKHVGQAKSALDKNSFTDFWLFLDYTNDNSITLEVRTYADTVSVTHDDSIITKRLIYTAHIAIHEKEAHIESNITIAALV